jgi:hypothetical protein
MMASKPAAQERQAARRGNNDADAGGEPFGGGAVGGHAQPFQRQVGQDHPATCAGGQVQPGPAPPGADVQQAVGGRQAKPAGEGVGLDHGGVAVGAPVTADDPPFDPARDRRGGSSIALLEQGSCL